MSQSEVPDSPQMRRFVRAAMFAIVRDRIEPYDALRIGVEAAGLGKPLAVYWEAQAAAEVEFRTRPAEKALAIHESTAKLNEALAVADLPPLDELQALLLTFWQLRDDPAALAEFFTLEADWLESDESPDL
jgi:hypothetical protein